MSLTFEIKGDDALIRKLARFHPEVIPAATRAIAEALKGYLAHYPGPVKHPIRWASRKQRAWYHAMRKEQGLPLAYTRNSDPMSQRLGASASTANVGNRQVGGWSTDNRGMDAVVGTRVTYAPWVQSAEKQQPMHAATGWITDKQAIEKAQAAHVADRIWKQIVEKWDK